jgi:hypothetical protein
MLGRILQQLEILTRNCLRQIEMPWSHLSLMTWSLILEPPRTVKIVAEHPLRRFSSLRTSMGRRKRRDGKDHALSCGTYQNLKILAGLFG